jgi:DNA (cytosine-5)-methyltransferase 1
MNYYNEFDPFAAAWLRELIKAKLIPYGDVDDRPIQDVRAGDLRGYTQCHFFAGISGWSEALRLANWPNDRPVWTGSCPCQPFSSAGKQKGKNDERHLWPVWFDLIRESRPPVVFGEQVSAAIHHGWWDDVADDLEREGYTTRAEIRPACSVGSPNKRDRLWFVADAQSARSGGACGTSGEATGGSEAGDSLQFGRAGAERGTLGNAEYDGSYGGQVTGSNGTAICDHTQGQDCAIKSAGTGQSGDVADTEMSKRSRFRPITDWQQDRPSNGGSEFWQYGEWVKCPDGKQRLIEPSIRLLAHGIPNRVGKLRGYGNAIVPQVAAQFIQAYMMAHP